MCTVLSARPWEPALVRLARATALVRVVGRAWEPGAVDATAPTTVVVGAETAWLSAGIVAGWHRLGRTVIGVHASGSMGERATLADAGVDAIVPDDDVERLLLTARHMGDPAHPAESLINVVGTRGAPGRSTVAIALAGVLPGATLVDGDPAPNLGPALGLPPGPTPEALVEALHEGTAIPGIHHVGEVRVLAPTGPVPDEVVACLRSLGPVVVDSGPLPGAPLPSGASREVFVVDASPAGIVRAGIVLSRWERMPPDVVLNRVPPDSLPAVRACRAATGLEPTALIPLGNGPRELAGDALAGILA